MVRNGRDQIEHFIVVLQDLSSQKALEERLRELSATDGLTRIANRRSFYEGLRREWERGIRQGTPLSVALAGADAQAAKAVAEGLRAAVESLALPHAANPGPGVVTLSLGVATMQPTPDEPPMRLVERADAQLYRAKAGGRNRVEG